MAKKIKKKVSMKILFLLIVSLVLCYSFYISYPENGVIIVKDKSFFSDFEIIGDEVHIYCVISLKNNSADIKQVKLIGDFKKEVDKGLLKSGTLKAQFLADDADAIYIGANSSIDYIKVDFIGEYAGISEMNSRKLPSIKAVEIERDSMMYKSSEE